MFKKILVSVVLVVLLISTNAVALEDISGHQHEESIVKLISLGIIEGKGDSRFHPEATLTRAEAAKVAVMMKGFSEEDIADISKVQVFNDVHEGMSAHRWAIPWINKAFDLGLIIGVGDGRFNPSGTLQMNEWVTILVRLTRNSEKNMSWPVDYENKAKSLGIIEGVDYSGHKRTTRAQMARMSENALSKPIYRHGSFICDRK